MNPLKIDGAIGDKELADKLGHSIRGAKFLMSKLNRANKVK
jgi:DNA-binding CsgD family transcriptional regulator